MVDDQSKSSQRPSASDDGVWARIHEAIESLETHLAMAINHPGALPLEKRLEIERRLDELRLKIAARDAQGQ